MAGFGAGVDWAALVTAKLNVTAQPNSKQFLGITGVGKKLNAYVAEPAIFARRNECLGNARVLPCWRSRPRDRGLSLSVYDCPAGLGFGEGAETCTRGRVRSPEDDNTVTFAPVVAAVNC